MSGTFSVTVVVAIVGIDHITGTGANFVLKGTQLPRRLVNHKESPVDIAAEIVKEVTGITPSGDGGWAPIKSLPPVIEGDSVYLSYGTLLPIEACKLTEEHCWAVSGQASQEPIEAQLIPQIMAMIS